MLGRQPGLDRRARQIRTQHQVRVTQLQDVGTHLMLSADLAGTPVKARLPAQHARLMPGSDVGLRLLGEHTCFYIDEELVP